MKKKHLKYLVCPGCYGSLKLEVIKEDPEEIQDGIFSCTPCENWFPLSNGVGFFLEDHYVNAKEFRISFLTKHNIKEKTVKSIVDPSLNDKNDQILFFAEEAEKYDEFHTDSRFVRYLDHDLLVYWNKFFPKQGVVLDLGCGTGMRTLPLAATHKNNEFIALDISADMIWIAHEEAKMAKLENVSFLVGDAQRPPMAANTCETVVGAGILHHVPSPECVLKQVNRVLKVSGYYLGIENNKTLFRFLFDIYQKIAPVWREKAGTHPVISKSDLNSWVLTTELKVEAFSRVFVFPQMINKLPQKIAKIVWLITEMVGQHLPLFKNNGGMLFISARRQLEQKF